jgi:hypothetical protein
MERLRIAICALLALAVSACATTPPPGATGPRPNEPPYPVLLTETADRREATLVAWAKFTSEQGIKDAPAPELHPVTGAIRSLPTFTGTPLYLPKVGDAVPMNEDNTRESLRRFIMSAIPLLGARQQQLSLVQRIDAADGTKKALYEQRKLEITFTPDRRVLQITSTCIPETEQLQRASSGIRPKWDAEKVSAQVAGRTFTYRDSASNTQTVTIAQGEKLTVRELVIYPLPRLNDPAILELHLAWEISLERGANSVNLYLDAVTDELLGVDKFSD